MHKGVAVITEVVEVNFVKAGEGVLQIGLVIFYLFGQLFGAVLEFLYVGSFEKEWQIMSRHRFLEVLRASVIVNVSKLTEIGVEF